MTSPSSIYAAVCTYDALFDALHGADDLDMDQPHRKQVEDLLLIIHIHFGSCSIFEESFDTILSCESEKAGKGAEELPFDVIEMAVHKSVRHLCDEECFLRAYHPIREFTFLWRDVIIDHPSDDVAAASSPSASPSRHMKKEHLLDGWSCQLIPKCNGEKSDDAKSGETKRKKRESPAPIIFISPDGIEFDTKSKAISNMNKSFTSMQQSISPCIQQPGTSTSTQLIDITAKMNNLYSPLGLLEELFIDDPWKLLVSTICLNVTTRQQVDKALHQFLQQYPDAITTAKANWQDISEIISPLGLGTKRAKGLIRFSTEFLELTKEYDAFKLTEKQVKSLYNVGQYGWTAYEVFILKELPSGSVKVCDHALQLYVECQLGVRALMSKESLSSEFVG